MVSKTHVVGGVMLTRDQLVHLLRRFETFRTITDKESTLLFSYLREQIYQPGDWIIREGDRSRELLFFASGSADILKEDAEWKEPIRLETVYSGDLAGEMAFLEQKNRSASIRAVEKTKILFLDLERLKSHPEGQRLYQKLLKDLAIRLSARLRNMDTNLIHSLKEKIKLLWMQNEVGGMIVTIFILAILYLNLAKLFSAYLPAGGGALHLFFYSAVLVCLGLISFALIYTSRYPLRFYGLTFDHLARNIWGGVLCSVPLVATLFLIRFFFPDIPLTLAGQDRSLYLLVFLFIPPLQEFIARSFLQVSFKHFLQGRFRTFSAIVCSNLVFNIFSTVNNIWYSALFFCFGLVWGALFERQKSIVGSSVSHALVMVASHLSFEFFA